ncbi:DoxX protein [Zhouia amylolytica]|nr:DoxX family protein [Zhouia amylolytica]MCQ0112409.1 DoxX family membrane protein [Zhouia amylolytica]SFT00402.1 DoxX protein [Zhouia amylolytica]
MGTVKTLNKWANAHTYYPLDLIRVALGVFLFFKGIHFIGNTELLIELIDPLKNWAGSLMMVHYVAPAHLIGGLLIAFGLLTRWAIIAQLPILIGAVAINFFGPMDTKGFLSALIILVICAFFLVYGSGKHSADYYFKMQK